MSKYHDKARELAEAVRQEVIEQAHYEEQRMPTRKQVVGALVDRVFDHFDVLNPGEGVEHYEDIAAACVDAINALSPVPYSIN